MSEQSKVTCQPVPHIRQKYNWDCGLASVQMVLGYKKVEYANFAEICRQLDFGNSVWTIDLAFILHHYQVPFHFYTITLGVDKGYSSESFYKNEFSRNAARVNKQFEEAAALRLAVTQRSVPLSELVEHSRRGGVLIVLIDWNQLYCLWCNSVKCFNVQQSVCQCVKRYIGHYIVICGVSYDGNEFYFKNPARKQDLCCCSADSLEHARKSYGTDEDILFIH